VNPKPTRVLIADDHAVVREGIRHVLSATPDFVVVGEAGTGAEALQLAKTHHPDVIVLDLSMPDGSGFDTLASLRRSGSRARVLILSIQDHERYVHESRQAGANGYLCKDSSPAELRDAVRALHRGEQYFNPAAVKRGGRLASLTPRERDVLRGIVQGKTNKEIAAELEISSRTVESHRESLMSKLGVHHVAALTRLALEEGIAPDPARSTP
jgi:DNA-binding NarL/FixJ family response regulator